MGRFATLLRFPNSLKVLAAVARSGGDPNRVAGLSVNLIDMRRWAVHPIVPGPARWSCRAGEAAGSRQLIWKRMVESPSNWRVCPVTIAPAPVAGSAGGMKIGALASRSGLPVKTLRYYEDLGLLPAVGRSPGGYRLFAEESLRRLDFIRRLKSLGLSLEDIEQCLAVHDAGKLPCGDIQRQLKRQIDLVDERLRELRQFRRELQSLLENWQNDPPPNTAVICPNLNV